MHQLIEQDDRLLLIELILIRFLADRTTYGSAYATVFRRLSVVCSVCTVAKRCVLEQKLLSTAYRKSDMMNRLIPK